MTEILDQYNEQFLNFRSNLMVMREQALLLVGRDFDKGT